MVSKRHILPLLIAMVVVLAMPPATMARPAPHDGNQHVETLGPGPGSDTGPNEQSDPDEPFEKQATSWWMQSLLFWLVLLGVRR